MIEPSRLHILFRQFKPFGIAALVLLSINWAATTIFEGMELWGKPWQWSPWRSFTLVLFSGLVLYIFFMQDKLFTISFTTPPVEPKQHLVLFLSLLTDPVTKTTGIPPWSSLTGNLERDLLDLETIKRREPHKKWSWEMPLRAIWHHLPETAPMKILKSVTVVCSDKSLDQAPLFFGNVISKYPELHHLDFFLLVSEKGCWRLIKVNPVNPDSFPSLKDYKAPDFEDCPALHSGFYFLFREFRRLQFQEHEVVVDFTGGQKVTSGVAMLMTFNRQIKAQYIQTEDPWSIQWFDIVLGFRPTGGMS